MSRSLLQPCLLWRSRSSGVLRTLPIDSSLATVEEAAAGLAAHFGILAEPCLLMGEPSHA